MDDFFKNSRVIFHKRLQTCAYYQCKNAHGCTRITACSRGLEGVKQNECGISLRSQGCLWKVIERRLLEFEINHIRARKILRTTCCRDSWSPRWPLLSKEQGNSQRAVEWVFRITIQNRSYKFSSLLLAHYILHPQSNWISSWIPRSLRADLITANCNLHCALRL